MQRQVQDWWGEQPAEDLWESPPELPEAPGSDEEEAEDAASTGSGAADEPPG